MSQSSLEQENSKKTKVVATGAFELLHPGHILFLEEASKLGDELLVIVARDKKIKERKGRVIIPEKQRLEVVKSLNTVDHALLGDKEDIFQPIENLKPDIIALGKDQHFNEERLKKELENRNLKIRVTRIQKHWHSDNKLDSTRKIVRKIKELS